MSDGPTSPTAMWRSLVDRAGQAAKACPGRTTAELLREYVYERALARVFAEHAPYWVLKGGTALLMRVDDARHSKDIDLLHHLGDIDAAQEDLRRALDRDLGDFLRFVIRRTRPLGQDQQPEVIGRQVDIQCLSGTKPVIGFHIDLVVGSLMTAEPETKTHSGPIVIPNVDPPQVRLYPLVDHLADKVCATETIYAGGRESSRVRDLVDIIVIALSHEIDGTALHAAIMSERTHRGLPTRTTFTAPANWTQQQYQTLATNACPHDLADAVRLARFFLDPAMLATVGEKTWSPSTSSWTTPDEALPEIP